MTAGVLFSFIASHQPSLKHGKRSKNSSISSRCSQPLKDRTRRKWKYFCIRTFFQSTVETQSLQDCFYQLYLLEFPECKLVDLCWVCLTSAISWSDPPDPSAHCWIRAHQTSAPSALWETGWKPSKWNDIETTSRQPATRSWSLWPGCPLSE